MAIALHELDYETMVSRHIRDHDIMHMAHILYDRARSRQQEMVPWRKASKVVKREFIEAAKQELGLR